MTQRGGARVLLVDDDEANALRDRIYAAVHAGARHQWALHPPARPGRCRAGQR